MNIGVYSIRDSRSNKFDQMMTLGWHLDNNNNNNNNIYWNKAWKSGPSEMG